MPRRRSSGFSFCVNSEAQRQEDVGTIPRSQALFCPWVSVGSFGDSSLVVRSRLAMEKHDMNPRPAVLFPVDFSDASRGALGYERWLQSGRMRSTQRRVLVDRIPRPPGPRPRQTRRARPWPAKDLWHRAQTPAEHAPRMAARPPGVVRRTDRHAVRLRCVTDSAARSLEHRKRARMTIFAAMNPSVFAGKIYLDRPRVGRVTHRRDDESHELSTQLRFQIAAPDTVCALGPRTGGPRCH